MAASFSRFCRVSIYIVAVVLLSLTATSCQLAKNQLEYDRSAEADRQHYRDVMAPVALPEQTAEDMPDFQPVLSTPEELRLPSPLVTVSVNQTVSLRDLMFELADQADVDIEMDPQIRGSIIFTAKERPFDQVIDRICAMAGLRYTFTDNVLRVELDRPFVKNYSVDYINVSRTSNSSISTSIEMNTSLAGGSEGGTDAGAGGSDSNVRTSSSGDLWAELAESLEQILTSSDTYTSLATLADPVAMAVNPLQQPVTYDANGVPTTPPALPGSQQAAPMGAAAAPTLNISTPPAEPLVPNAPATFSISRQSGVVSVFANQRQQVLVQKFLDDFRKRSTTQILIEAKVLQVDLNDEFSTGIDWSNFNVTGLTSFSLNAGSPGMSPAANAGFTGVIKSGSDINMAIEAISRFGTVRALSSPRVTVMNGQPAVVNVAQNNVYFSFDVQTEEDSDTNETTITVESEQRGVPEGVLLNVVPTANPDTGEILMVVRPTVSKITRFVDDPTIALSLAGIGANAADFEIPQNQVPEVSVQEIDSMLRIQSGQVMVMGGLMRDINTATETGVPIVGDVPFFGHLFKNHADKITKSELVIFVRAVIVPGSNIEDMDRKIYKEFGEDRRPARM
jgi:MSHA biogenesis protein MshL